MRVGAKLPDFGQAAIENSIGDCARRAEEAGFDSVWVSDHIVMPVRSQSPYPFSKDGRMTWEPTAPWYEAIVSMAVASASTRRVEIGSAVLVVPLRNPILLAKQIATLDVLSKGRVTLGVGAGWLAEEFEALNVPFADRGSLLTEWIEIMRDCWEGSPRPRKGAYTVPEGVICQPIPTRRVPILIGGTSPAAIRRIVSHGDGWLGFMDIETLNPKAVGAIRRKMAAGAINDEPKRVALRIVGDPYELASYLPDLQRAGVDDVIVNVPWHDPEGPAKVIGRLRSALT